MMSEKQDYLSILFKKICQLLRKPLSLSKTNLELSIIFFAGNYFFAKERVIPIYGNGLGTKCYSYLIIRSCHCFSLLKRLKEINAFFIAQTVRTDCVHSQSRNFSRRTIKFIGPKAFVFLDLAYSCNRL